jgi:hypothetical protein
MATVNRWKVSTLLLAGALVVVTGHGGAVTEAQAEAQPRMQAALVSLKQAAAQLRHASHDKGGHRARALEATLVAIDQVKKGIRYDNAH